MSSYQGVIIFKYVYGCWCDKCACVSARREHHIPWNWSGRQLWTYCSSQITFRRESIKEKKRLGMELSGRQLAQSVRGPGLHPQGHTPTHQQTDTHTPTLSPAHPFNVQSLSPKPPQICTQRSPSHDASLQRSILILSSTWTFEERQDDKVWLGTHEGLTLPGTGVIGICHHSV